MSGIDCGSDCTACSLARNARMAREYAGGSRVSPKEAAAARFPGLPAGRVALLVAAALVFGLGLVFRPALQAMPGVIHEYGVFLLAYGLAGGKIVAQALRNLFRGRVLDEYFLMTAASAGAFAIGELPEAVAVMLFFTAGQLLEDMAVGRSRRSIAALMETRPDYANLVKEDGAVQAVDPDTVRPGRAILVKPGEKIPLDGVVERGDSFIDNAALTGESVPLRVAAGDAVLAGAINGPGLLQVTVTRPFGESSLARVFELVREAAGRKAKTEAFITRFARYYTPGVVLGALSLALLPPLLLPGAEFSTWLYRALVLLVISCPCALVISIPLGYFGGIGSASRHGILVKGGNFLEALLKVKTVVFDKTGTLTKGSFRVTEVLPRPGFSEEELLAWAAHAELHSHHPIARSIRAACPRQLRPAAVEQYEERRGLGVKALVDGRTVLAGSDRLLRREGVEYQPCERPGSVVYLALDGLFAGCLVIGDELRDDAAAAVRRLKELGVKRTVMLTGDNQAEAQAVAVQVGIDQYHASLLPEEKVERLAALLDAAGREEMVAFVGDGINDAPVLARSDVGIAMGGLGSDAAIEAADVVIMDDRPYRVARAVEIAAFTRKIVVQNIVLALGVKGFFVVMGAAGAASIWEAVFADVGVALLAILNATRILSK